MYGCHGSDDVLGRLTISMNALPVGGFVFYISRQLHFNTGLVRDPCCVNAEQNEKERQGKERKERAASFFRRHDYFLFACILYIDCTLPMYVS